MKKTIFTGLVSLFLITGCSTVNHKERSTSAVKSEQYGDMTIKIGAIWGKVQRFVNSQKPHLVKASDKLFNNRLDHKVRILELNKSKEFRGDRVSLRPYQDLPGKPTVGDLLVTLVVEYEKNGWEVVR